MIEAACSKQRETSACSARNVRDVVPSRKRRTAESRRMEDVVRGSEEVGPPDDPRLTPADESQMASARWQ